jgi:protein-L-isoaspartate O-methyltransferase
MNKTQVLVIGLEPNLVDFSTMPEMNAEKVQAGLEADQAKLAALGYEGELCLTDLGDTAAVVVAQKLSEKPFDCVVIGAGIRTLPRLLSSLRTAGQRGASSGPRSPNLLQHQAERYR